MHIYVTFYILPFFSLKEDAGIYIYIVILTIYIYIYEQVTRSPGSSSPWICSQETAHVHGWTCTVHHHRSKLGGLNILKNTLSIDQTSVWASPTRFNLRRRRPFFTTSQGTPSRVCGGFLLHSWLRLSCQVLPNGIVDSCGRSRW